MRVTLTIAIAALALTPAGALAQCPNGRCAVPTYYYRPQAVTYYAQPTPQTYQPPSYVQTVAYTQTPTAPATADPYNFGPWINSVRAQYGLPALAHDPNLSGWAASNSAAGFGHAVRASRYQNAGQGAGSQVWPMWLSSPAHAAPILDGSVRTYGIAYVNGNWTLNLN